MVIRRAALTFALAAIPAAYASRALAVDALPDARFVGYAQAHNDFEIASARLALSKSGQRAHPRLRQPHAVRARSGRPASGEVAFRRRA